MNGNVEAAIRAWLEKEGADGLCDVAETCDCVNRQLGLHCTSRFPWYCTPAYRHSDGSLRPEKEDTDHD